MQTTLAPDEVVELFADFSEHRPERWPGLDPKLFAVYSKEATSAEVREGGPASFWARERYDWSRPGVVRWDVLESSFCKPGSHVQVSVSERAGGGTDVHVEWERTPSTFMGTIAMLGVKLTGGAPVRSSFEKGLRQAEARKGA